MLAKKVTALLVSAALVLTLLAGCGGSKALSQVIADLLSGLYTNLDVEVDSDLTAALKKAAAEGGTEDEILTRLVNNLNITGGSITFTRLGDGQQGDHGVDLVFQTGSDPDAAARSALAQWASVFGSLPDDGSYRAHVSMIEAENGYYIAVDVEVLKAGTPDKGETDPDPEPDPGYRVEDGTYFVTNATGLIAWADHVRAGNWDTNCTLEADIELTGSWEPIGTDSSNAYTGTFNGNGKTITGLTIDSSSQYVGMFGYLNGEVTKLTLASVSITSSWSDKTYAAVGAVAGNTSSNCNIANCFVSGNIVIGGTNSQAGGLVGKNYGAISQCQVKGLTITGPSSGNYIYLGGVVGSNSKTVEDCQVENLTITNGTNVGGVAGQTSSSSSALTGCSVKDSSVTGSSISGGVVGNKNSSSSNVTACYWSGKQTNAFGSSSVGVGVGDATHVTNEEGWEKALEELNGSSNISGYQFDGTMDAPSLSKKTTVTP